MDFAIFGYLGVLLTGTHLIPEVYKAIHTQHLRDVAWSMLILFLFFSISWAIYGFYLSVIPLIASATLNSSATATLLILKILYKKNDQPIAQYIQARRTDRKGKK